MNKNTNPKDAGASDHKEPAPPITEGENDVPQQPKDTPTMKLNNKKTPYTFFTRKKP